MSEREWTLLELLNAARDYLNRKEIENARGDAEALLGKVLGLPRIQLYVQHDRPMKPNEIAAYRMLLARRAQHEPLQLLMGSVEFLDIQIQVMPGLLIPRPETEELADGLIQAIRERACEAPIRILDIGTGTGCIAVALAHHLPAVRVDAVDVNFDAVRCAAANADRNHVAERVQVLSADVLSEKFVSQIFAPYDVVVSNPPYIRAADFESLPPEVKNYEARQALVAAENGLKFYRRIAELLPELLTPDGLLWVEIGYDQVSAVREIFAERLDFVSVRHDLTGHPRIVTASNSQVRTSKLPVS